MSSIDLPPDRRPTIRDVGREAGVSHTTVSLILNGKMAGSPETRARVFEAAQRLNYQAEASFRKSTVGRSGGGGAYTKILALILPAAVYSATRANDGYYSGVFAGACEAAAEAGWNILLCPQESNPSGIPEVIQDGRVDGVMVEGAFDSDWLAYLTKRFRCAFLNRSYSSLDAISVTPHWERAGIKMVEYAWELGHREFVFFQHDLKDENTFWVRHGQDTALERMGGKLSCPELSQSWPLCPQDNDEIINAFVDRWLASTPRPTAIMATDSYCRMLIRAMKARGISIPEEVSFFGRSGGIASMSEAPLMTTYRYPVHRIGYTATQLLLRAIQEDSFQPTRIMLDGELIVRDSAKAL